jgi:RNA polymerase sigma factor (sigma-70 family)
VTPPATSPSRAALPPFQVVLDRHGPEVLGFLRAMVGPTDAEDCFQETFLAALRAYPRADGRNLRAWIFTIARRKAIDEHRARDRRPRPVRDPTQTAAPERGAASAPQPSADDVWESVGALPAAQRAAVALRFVGDMRYREIAAALGCSEAAARRRVADAVATLRQPDSKEAR